ncbi:MAG TPA: hypothetical protein VHR84_03315 [Terriglobales bacterium]|jgi:hypothetical protein|nr:hypothetical protein [Terriglobales bacterium]
MSKLTRAARAQKKSIRDHAKRYNEDSGKLFDAAISALNKLAYQCANDKFATCDMRASVYGHFADTLQAYREEAGV